VLVLNGLLLVVFSPASRAADQVPTGGDLRRGKTLFQQTCALCHASGLEKQLAAGQGPLLAGVVGRPAASLPHFGYTKALGSSHLTWDAATLDRFLAGPTALVPGTTMVITVANPEDRRDLITFLAALRPVSLPEQRAEVSSLRGVPTPGDWQNDHPGMLHRIRLENLPAPYATVSAGNPPYTVDRPAGASLSVPAGFQVKLFASGLSGPRLLRSAPNGDIFIAETRRGRIRVLRAADGADAPSENTIFAGNLEEPFGIGFYPLGGNPQWVYVANLNSVVRFPYHNGDLEARGPAETVVAHLADSTGGHTTRDIAFSLNGQRMFISVGSG
jgi:cytochrome c2